MKKTFSVLLSVMMAAMLIVGVIPAVAVVGYDTVTLAVGQTDSMQSVYVSSAISINNTVCTVYVSGNLLYLTGNTVGTTYVSYTTLAGAQGTLVVTVTNTTASTGTISLAVGQTDVADNLNALSASVANPTICSAIVANGKLSITGLKAGSTIVSWQGYTTGSIYPTYGTLTVVVGGGTTATTGTVTIGIGQTETASNLNAWSATAANPAICTVNYTNGVLSITGLKAGSTTVTWYGMPTGATSNTSGTIYVVVTGTGTGTNTTITVAKGASQNVAGYYNIQSPTSSNSSVATVTMGGSLGSQYLIITGVNTGSTTISFYSKSAYSDSYTYNTLNVTVTGSSSIPTNESTATTGIYLGTNKTLLAKLSKSYKLGTVKLNGVSITSDRSKVLWVSSDTDVLTVKTDGIFKAVGKGTANLIAVTKDGKYTAVIAITVS